MRALLKLNWLMGEPEPEQDPALTSASVPILLELEGLRLLAPSHLYVVWRLESSPVGDYTHAGIHCGLPSWEGVQSLLATGTYVRGRDRLRRVEARDGADALEAARILYFEEQQAHGAPSRLRIWYWPCSCEAELCRRVQRLRAAARDTPTQDTLSSQSSSQRRRT
eukprot:4842953-Amphidinium_carterae.7